MTAQPDTAARQTRWIDPRTLVTRDNVRGTIDPDPELVESVRVHGVLQPPLVYADGPDLVLIAGHRRAAAAIAADLDRIEVVVGQPMDPAQRVAAQVSENTNRSGLRVAEVAAAVDQLTLLGVPVGQIAKAAGLRAAQVEAARRVAAAGQETRAAVAEAPELTLDQAAALTDWEDVPGAVDELLTAAAAGPVRFAHEQARLTEEREARAAVDAAVAGWTAKGYRTFRHEEREALPVGSEPLHELADAEGKRLVQSYYGASEAHASCPGRAVVLGRWSPETVEELCLDPQANGHTKAPRGGSGRPAVSAEAAKAERKRVIDNNKLWRAATGVRHDHIKGFIRGGKFPPALVADLHRHLLAHPDHLAYARGKLFDDLTGFPGSGMSASGNGRGPASPRPAADAPHNRVAGLLLAAAADAAEKSLDDTTWRSSNRGAAGWLDLLVSHTGYQLADIEVTAMNATTPGWKPPRPASAAAPTRAAAANRTARQAESTTTTTAAPRSKASRGRAAKQ